MHHLILLNEFLLFYFAVIRFRQCANRAKKVRSEFKVIVSSKAPEGKVVPKPENILPVTEITVNEPGKIVPVLEKLENLPSPPKLVQNNEQNSVAPVENKRVPGRNVRFLVNQYPFLVTIKLICLEFL